MKTSVCKNCGNEYPSRNGKVCCSLGCRDELRVKSREAVVLTRKCEACGKEFEVPYYGRKHAAHACSMACVGELNRRRIAGTRDESKHETVSCATCGLEFERLKVRTKKRFCGKSCAYEAKREIILRTPRARRFLVQLKNGDSLTVRSRWEALFIKDFLEKKDLRWKYEWETFILSDGRRYTPDFYIVDDDVYVEIKGHRWATAEKAQLLRKLDENVIYADAGVLTSVYGLSLKQTNLKRVAQVVEINEF